MACERNDLGGLGDAQDHARILHREEALGNDDVEKTVSATSVPNVTSKVAVWCFSTHCSVRP